METLKSIAIEQKVFSLAFNKGAPEAQAVIVVEKSRSKTFRATTTEGGARWMSRFLCECSATNCTSSRYQDLRVSIVGIVRNNNRGIYVEFSCFEKGSKGFKKVLCFSAGVNQEGWAKAGLEFLFVLDRDLDLGCQNYKAQMYKKEPSASQPKSFNFNWVSRKRPESE
ncbi:hypothetical protein FRX31_015706 [Thalictrum thalictroides]|uniref:Uncharacterized protein n=1 Tax=Thalictrum thalictroides TaxID=46969 RepID=A0A7J6WBJ4_THATH|nr:hypothetical protein FRX31_015706 [Thalictrum thalictroides]